MIKYYLDQDAIIPNVETNICREPDGLALTLDRLDELVVKPVGEAGGYGITIGPRATKAELEDCRAKLLADPSNYISQPMIPLSVCPTLVDEGSSRVTWIFGLSRSPAKARGSCPAAFRA